MSLLSAGTKLQSDGFGEVTVEERIGSGGQGDVYRVSTPSGQYALKWYTKSVWKSLQHRKAMAELVNAGAPNNPIGAGKRFLWPQAIVTGGDADYGYLMDLFPRGVCSHREVVLGRAPQPSLYNLCNISFELAHSFRALHLSGYCYRDISEDNIQFDPVRGYILICDNDNVGVNGQCDIGIRGTLPFMAPEVILNQQAPSTLTDLHSLAVLLFRFWIAHHPFHGALEYDLMAPDLKDWQNLYGHDPVFIFNPNDTRNYPPLEYKTPLQRWSMCPASIRNTFLRAFTVGVKDPNSRVAETYWRTLFLKLRDGVHSCVKCNAEIILDLEDSDMSCWYCQTKISVPPKLIISKNNKKHEIPLLKSTKIYPYHVHPTVNESYESLDVVLGDITQNPNKPSVWGLRNCTKLPWDFRAPDGSKKIVPPGKAAPLNVGGEIYIEGAQICVSR